MRPTRRPHARLPLPLLLTLLLVAACGGGGADGPAEPGITPTVAILFPPGVSLTTSPDITVRGESADPTGIAAVRVNGTPATTTDGFATWRAMVPLALGATTLQVDIETTGGDLAAGAATASIRRVPVLLPDPVSCDRDPSSGVAYVHDRLEGLLAYAASSDIWSRVSSEGPPVTPPQRALAGALDSAAGTYYVLYDRDLVAIDVQTGARTSVTGTGPSLSTAGRDLDADGAGYGWMVGYFSSIGNAVVRVDLATGDRFEHSSDSVGSGPLFSSPAAVHVPGGSTDVYVYDGGLRALVQVDAVTGDRSVLLDSGTASGFMPLLADGLLVDPAATKAYVARRTALYVLDWSASTATLLLDAGEDQLGVLGTLTDLAPGPGDRILLADAPGDGLGWSGLSTFDPATGTLTVHPHTAVGTRSGEVPLGIQDLVMDPPRQRLLFTDRDGLLHGLDPATGITTVVSGDGVGNGPAIGTGSDGALVTDGGDTAYVGRNDQLFSVDIPTGDRALVSAEGLVGTGPAFDDHGGLAWDPGARRVVAGTSVDDLLLRIDPATGDRTPFTSEVLYDLYDVDLDASLNRLYLATETDSDGYLLRTADLATGVVAPLLYQDDDTSDHLDGVELLASDPETGRLFVFNTRSWIHEIDATTGLPSFLADTHDVAAGPASTYVFSLAAAVRTGIVYLGGGGSILALDADTGERVVIAK